MLRNAKALWNLYHDHRRLFREVPENSAFLNDIARRGDPQNTYVIFFMPRSGSTRLTRLLGDTCRTNAPGELFSEKHLRNRIIDSGAQNISEFVARYGAKQHRAGNFGCKVTYKQVVGHFEIAVLRGL